MGGVIIIDMGGGRSRMKYCTKLHHEVRAPLLGRTSNIHEIKSTWLDC